MPEILDLSLSVMAVGALGAGSVLIWLNKRSISRAISKEISPPPVELPPAFYVPPVDRKPHVLVVDDDISVADILSMMLAQLGCDVTVLHNPMAVLAWLEHEKPDLVLSDIRMPLKSGLQLATDIHDLYPAQPIALMTGYVDEFSGVDDRTAFKVLHKPIALHDLQRMLQMR